MLKYLNIFEHQNILSNHEENRLVSETQIKRKLMEQETTELSCDLSFFFRNIST